MDPRVSFITLVVGDIGASRRFYVEGLGWPVEFEAPGEVIMIRVGHKLVLSLWDEVDLIIARAGAAGASVTAEPVARDWGGYSGYFADPDGFRWEIAWNPGEVGQSVL